jgi:hypothetical protein
VVNIRQVSNKWNKYVRRRGVCVLSSIIKKTVPQPSERAFRTVARVVAAFIDAVQLTTQVLNWFRPKVWPNRVRYRGRRRRYLPAFPLLNVNIDDQ